MKGQDSKKAAKKPKADPVAKAAAVAEKKKLRKQKKRAG